MKNLYVLLVIALIYSSCHEAKRTPLKTEEKKTDEMEQVIQEILDCPELQSMYHAELPERAPLKLVENEYVKAEWNLIKFNRKVCIAPEISFKNEGIEDYLVIDLLERKNDTIHTSLYYDAEGIKVAVALLKNTDSWVIEKFELYEIELQPQFQTVRKIVYLGGDLGHLSTQYYGNNAYRHVLSSYNIITDRSSIKQDSLRIPELAFLSRDNSLPYLQTIHKELDKVITARSIYLKEERNLWDLPKDTENQNYRPVSQEQKQKLLGASKLLFECVAGLAQHTSAPKKAIGQFTQVAENLENIANGKIDKNGYALDLVHQRLSYGLGNIITWAQQNNH